MTKIWSKSDFFPIFIDPLAKNIYIYIYSSLRKNTSVFVRDDWLDKQKVHLPKQIDTYLSLKSPAESHLYWDTMMWFKI